MARNRDHCIICRRSASEAGYISASAKCGDCAARAALESIEAMANKSGPAYEKWLAKGGANGRPITKYEGSGVRPEAEHMRGFLASLPR